MSKIYIAMAGIALFLFVWFALPLVDFEDSPTSLNSLTPISTSSVKIGRGRLSPEEAELINAKIKEAG